MGSFFAELKQRHIYRVAAAYAVVAWVLIQLINNIAPALKLPDWTATLVIVLVAVGFPIALIFAWTLELKGAGPSADAPTVGATGKGADASQQLTIAAVSRSASTPRTGTLSVAVLPFANMSGDANQDFFSD